jgi:hypothetical protein
VRARRRLPLFLLAALVVAAIAGTAALEMSRTKAGSYRSAVLADRPLAYWPMTEKFGSAIKDASGHERGLRLFNEPALGVAGPLKKDPATGMDLDGLNEHGETAGDLDFVGREPFSVEAWIEPQRGVNTYQRVLSNEFFALNVPRSGWDLYNNPRLGAGFEWFGFRGQKQAAVAVKSARALPLNTYTYVVGTFDGAALRLYVNGALVDTKRLKATAQLRPIPYPLTVGRIAGLPRDFYRGALAQVAIYGHDLSAARVGAHYRAARHPTG